MGAVRRLAHNWKRFKWVWENYEIASGLKEMGNDKTFLINIGHDGIEICDSLPLPADKKNNMDEILSKV